MSYYLLAMGRKKTILSIIAAAVILLAAGYGAGRFSENSSGNNNTAKVSEKDYPLLAKRIFVENPSDSRINFSPLRTALRQYFNDKQLTGSLHFEYLPTGTSVRINGDTQFRGASLIKLPVAMELYKTEELGKINLDEKIKLKPEWLHDGFGTLYEKGAGYELSYREAAKIMLSESDNTALRAVASVTETALQSNDRALGSLDVDFSQSTDEGINISARSYSSFLKCLYFACFNSKQHSQEILSYLIDTKFTDRIVAGISDKNIKVAHKVGIFNTQVQSDCGIVYAENNNYVLCIMLNGNNDPTTNGHMAEISKIVYSYIKDPS